MNVGEVIADRFELTEWVKWSAHRGVDRTTGKPVLFPPTTPSRFLDELAMEAMSDVVAAADDPRLANVLHRNPVVLEGPSKKEPKRTVEEWAAITLELVDVLSKLGRLGVTPAFEAWATRDEHRLRVAIPIRPPGLHYREWHVAIHTRLQNWFELKLDQGWIKLGRRNPFKRKEPESLSELVQMVAQIAGTRADHIDVFDGRVSPKIDFDRAIERGEATMARLASDADLRRWHECYAAPGLAAVFHHRACVRWAGGSRDAATRDADRAIELDEHTKLLTTRALFAEALGDPAAAGLHDRAVRAIVPAGDADDYESPPLPWDADPPHRLRRDAARALHARGVFRWKQGDLAGAKADLEAALSHQASDAIRNALDKVVATTNG